MTTLTPTSGRAKSRVNDHTLEVVRHGVFNGHAAVLTHCVDTDCPNLRRDGSAWTGWFTDKEMKVS